VTERGTKICSVIGSEDSNRRDEANAQLIAAAPELLAQLKKAVECLPDLNKWDRQPMVDAIKKAEGRQ
jgi:hypothetical protein